MHLVNKTLVSPSICTASVVGSFTGGKGQEVCLVRGGSRLQLTKVDDLGQLVPVGLDTNAYGIIRSISAIRLLGEKKDLLVVGSDAGRVAVLEYDPAKLVFVRADMGTFGRTGSRRIVPGEMIVADPRGRCFMTSALERGRLLYVVSRDIAGDVHLSSPLDAQRLRTITEAIVGVDSGFDNPVFAALELTYAEDSLDDAYEHTDKFLSFYELDLSLNHVVKKWSEPTVRSANKLFALPGGLTQTGDPDGPSGVLVCAESSISYVNPASNVKLSVPVPRRLGASSGSNVSSPLIVAGFVHKMKSGSFALLQTEEGDLFKITVPHHKGTATHILLEYFDTIPVCRSLCILKSGFLVAVTDLGAPRIYQFLALESDQKWDSQSSSSFEFEPSLENTCLSLVSQEDSISPITQLAVANYASTSASPQIYAALGHGALSALVRLQYGVQYDEFVASDLPGSLRGVWTLKQTLSAEHDSFIVLSFINATLVLAIGDSVDEYDHPGFQKDTPTIDTALLYDDSLIQVTPRALRHVKPSMQVDEWPAPAGTRIIASSANALQVALALSNGVLVYFELDTQNGQLKEFDEHPQFPTIVNVALAPLPKGRIRFPFLTVACDDLTVHIVSLNPGNVLETLSTQAVTALPSSLLCTMMNDPSLNPYQESLLVYIGLQSGVVIRTVLDPSGTLTDSRSKFLGTKPVSLHAGSMPGNTLVFALSSRSWVNYVDAAGASHFVPVTTNSVLDAVAPLATEAMPHSFVAASDATLRIFSLSLSGAIQQTRVPLNYTPRKMWCGTKYIFLVEADHRKSHADATVPGSAMHPPRTWASCIRVIDPESLETVHLETLPDNEAAFCVTHVAFDSTGQAVVVVGTSTGASVVPKDAPRNHLRAYELGPDGSLTLLHTTDVDDVPTALLPFKGRLAVGVGKAIRIYDIGKARLLRKSEATLPRQVVSLESQGSRIVAGDIEQSVFFLVYKSKTNRVVVFAQDTANRYVSSLTMLDYQTAFAGDRFGNIFATRISRAVSDLADQDDTGHALLQEKPFLMGTPHRSDLAAHFHLGDAVTSVSKASLSLGGAPLVVYGGILGSIGVLVPLRTKDDCSFFVELEASVRSSLRSLIGRDHLSYRSAYTPVKAIVDGDLCAEFGRLPPEDQARIADSFSRSIGEVHKKMDTVLGAAW